MHAEDVAGNWSEAATSVELDNTPEAPVILQPGPAALTDGVAELHRHIGAWAAGTSWTSVLRSGD